MGPPVRRADPIDPAAEELYGAPLTRFTGERKRLADGARAGGDRALAARIAALPRPTLAAWVVNQLWRQQHADMQALLAAGQRMRAGEAGAWQEQRAVLSRLNAAAGETLRGDRHADSPATLRRVMANLQALSAHGTFAPDPPGRLVADRNPPGFEVLEEEAVPVVTPAPAPARRGERTGARAARARIAERADTERARAAARATIEQARAAAREKAERERLAEKARSRAAALGRTIDRLRSEVEEMEEKLADRREALRAAEAERDAALREAERALAKKSRP
jgi:hypothetical protein